VTKIISFASQKGGVGKTTLCLQFAHFLVKKKKKVLVIDLDPQGNSSTRLIDKSESDDNIEYHFSGTKTSDLFNEELDEINPAKCSYGMDLIWSRENDPELADLEVISLEKALNVRKHLKKIQKEYDFIVIDCPPALGRKLYAALAFSTHVVCPVKLSGFALSGLSGLIETIISVQQKVNSELKIAGIIVNNMDKTVRNARELEKLKSFAGDYLLKNIIMQRGPIDHASSDGLPIWDTPHGYVAGNEITKVMNELLKKIN